MEFSCLMLSGPGRLTDDLRTMLLFAAAQMIEGQEGEKRIEREDAEGVVTTDWHTTVLGSIVGIVFEARLGVESGDVTARYIFNPKTIPALYKGDGTWVELF